MMRPTWAPALSFTAFLLLVTGLLTPWWVVSWRRANQTYARELSYLFRDSIVAHHWATIATGTLLASIAIWIFIRWAGRSRKYEPAAWRRDLWLQGGLTVVALLSGMLWPKAVHAFWGGRTYVLHNGTGETFTESALPGIGWWLHLVAAALLLWAAWSERRATSTGKQTENG